MNFNNLFTLGNFLLFHLYFPILWLVYFIGWFKKKSLGKIFKVSWISYVFIIIVTVGVGAWLLYQQWSTSDLYKYLLPPESNFFYVVIARTLMFHVISIIVGLVLYFLFKLIVKLVKADFVAKEEIGLLALGAILVGWNNVVIYVGLIFLLMLLSSAFINIFASGRGKRLELMPYIFLSLIIVLLIGYQLSIIWGLY